MPTGGGPERKNLPDTHKPGWQGACNKPTVPLMAGL